MIDKNLINSNLKRYKERILISQDNIQTNSLIENLITILIESEFASIWIYDQRKSLLLRNRDYNFISKISTTQERGVLYKNFMTKECGVYNNLVTEVEYDEEVDNPDKIKIQSKIIIPLLDNNRLIGIATAYSSIQSAKEFTDYDLNLFKAIIPYIINGVHKIRQNCFAEIRNDIEEPNIDIENLQTKIDKKESSNKRLQDVANIVHDIRTPANSLYGFLDLLEEKIEDIRLKEYVKNAKESASFINELTTSILDNVAHKVEEKSSDDSINTALFFSKISEIFVSNMYKKHIGFNIFIDPLLPKEIVLNSMKLKRVIMNLIANAYKFTPTNHSIEFSVRYKQKDKKIHIFVKDTGIGIAKSKQEQIFEAFKQAEDETSSQYGGYGLGLAICARYVKELGGELKIESDIDQGSTFYFDIDFHTTTEDVIFKPISHSQAKICIIMDLKNKFVSNNIGRYLVRMGLDKQQIVATRNFEKIDTDVTHLIVFQNMFNENIESFCKQNKIKVLRVEEELFSIAITDSVSTNAVISQYNYYADILYSFVDLKQVPKVLIVDDDKISTSLLKNILFGEVCHIEIANNGATALEVLESSIKNRLPFSVVYMDNNMPMFSGDEVVNRLRNMEKIHSVESAYVASTSGDYIKEKDKNSNYNIYVPKPFDKNDILDIFYTKTAK